MAVRFKGSDFRAARGKKEGTSPALVIMESMHMQPDAIPLWACVCMAGGVTRLRNRIIDHGMLCRVADAFIFFFFFK